MRRRCPSLGCRCAMSAVSARTCTFTRTPPPTPDVFISPTSFVRPCAGRPLAAPGAFPCFPPKTARSCPPVQGQTRVARRNSDRGLQKWHTAAVPLASFGGRFRDGGVPASAIDAAVAARWPPRTTPRGTPVAMSGFVTRPDAATRRNNAAKPHFASRRAVHTRKGRISCSS